jgi:hypothetical protein
MIKIYSTLITKNLKIMSHFSRIKTSIREINLLKKSLNNLNLNWEEQEQLIEGYKGETHKVNLVIHQNNNIDIGFEKTKDNNYQLVADLSFWDQPTSVEAFLDSLHKEYALTTVLEETKKQGFEKISQTNHNQTGEVVIIVEKWNN